MDECADALVETAPDGIAFDGLRVERESDGYRFETPTGERTGLGEADLRAVATDSPFVTNWYFWHALAPQKGDRWAFCRWLEGADESSVPARYDALAEGVTTVWGELRVTVTLRPDEGRRYELRHVDDADSEELTDHDDPLDARTVAKFDDDGRYRPLKTAPSLQTGWRFADLDAAALVRAIDAFYPATIANWHREREGELDVTHWRDAVARQTGIYGVVETWDRGEGYEHVEWVAEACCDDSQCLKRRKWEYDDDTDLSVDGGDGEFPCREPCSLVISAARKWTRLEAEESRTYEFELTPSEKEQIEAIIDAVADGRTHEIREADFGEGANRWRARFLRAKRTDEDGALCGVPTERSEDGDGESEH